MNIDDTAEIEVDLLLSGFLNASTEDEAGERLVELREKVIAPTIRSSIHRHLQLSARNGTTGRLFEEAAELRSELELSIITRLKKIRETRDLNDIQNLQAYVRGAARNGFNQYLRRIHPERFSLRNQLKYLFTRKPGLRLCKNAQNEWMCGLEDFTGWESVSTLQLDAEIEARISAGPSLKTSETLLEIVTWLLDIYGRPVLFETFVSQIFDIKRLREPSELGADTVSLSQNSSLSDPGLKLEQQDTLKQLWTEIGRLPLLHRRAILLNLTGRSGESAIAELPMLRIASVREIAKAVEIPPEEFSELWPRLPLDDRQIAERFGLSRQQVINLRSSARSTLKKRLSR